MFNVTEQTIKTINFAMTEDEARQILQDPRPFFRELGLRLKAQPQQIKTDGRRNNYHKAYKCATCGKIAHSAGGYARHLQMHGLSYRQAIAPEAQP